MIRPPARRRAGWRRRRRVRRGVGRPAGRQHVDRLVGRDASHAVQRCGGAAGDRGAGRDQPTGHRKASVPVGDRDPGVGIDVAEQRPPGGTAEIVAGQQAPGPGHRTAEDPTSQLGRSSRALGHVLTVPVLRTARCPLWITPVTPLKSVLDAGSSGLPPRSMPLFPGSSVIMRLAPPPHSARRPASPCRRVPRRARVAPCRVAVWPRRGPLGPVRGRATSLRPVGRWEVARVGRAAVGGVRRRWTRSRGRPPPRRPATARPARA